jgi:hypothetical protein
MTVIQYKIPMDYSKEVVKQVAGILLKNLLTIVKNTEKNDKLKSSDFIFYPFSLFEIAKNKKLLMQAKGFGIKILNQVDSSFLKELEESKLRVYREEFTK